MNQHRQAEIKRYYDAYRNDSYYMKPSSQENFRSYLKMRDFTTMIDVGCGRGESLKIAVGEDILATGCEVVEYLCNEQVTWIEGAHDLSYVPVDYEPNELVTSIDVMEHLIEDDVIPAIKEMIGIGGLKRSKRRSAKNQW